MKKLLFSALFLFLVSVTHAQQNKTDVLQNAENKSVVNQFVNPTATLKASSRLFGTKDDLTSVIMVIPSGSVVNVLDSDSTYLHVVFEENEGFIFRRHAVLDKTPVYPSQTVKEQPANVQEQSVQKQVMSRLSYLENKYGSNLAAKIVAGKIWKGMNAEMVTDSWGIAEKVNRVKGGNILKEEWIYKNTWLYFENNILIEWGPAAK